MPMTLWLIGVFQVYVITKFKTQVAEEKNCQNFCQSSEYVA